MNPKLSTKKTCFLCIAVYLLKENVIISHGRSVFSSQKPSGTRIPVPGSRTPLIFRVPRLFQAGFDLPEHGRSIFLRKKLRKISGAFK